jgi:hypothetical protein
MMIEAQLQLAIARYNSELQTGQPQRHGRSEGPLGRHSCHCLDETERETSTPLLPLRAMTPKVGLGSNADDELTVRF